MFRVQFFLQPLFFLSHLLSLGACSLLTSFPEAELSQSERLAFFQMTKAPIQKPLTIHWDDYSIPFIEAQDDRDLAFAVGAVHAHLRLGQLELLRLASQGRLSEVAGPWGAVESIDQFLRTMNFPKAAENSKSEISEEAWEWVTAFTEGLNWYMEQMPRRPTELRVMDLEMEPFTPMEIVTIGKLVGVDLTWAMYLKYLKLQEDPNWKKFYDEDLKKLEGAQATAPINNPIKILKLIKNLTKSGSNALVVSGKRSQSGAGMIASDPHVGLFLPNFWILMGLKSPSYHSLGLMIPGVPFIGVGRNQDIAWGGTNMRAISSHLYLWQEGDAPLKTRTDALKRRWWTTKDLEFPENEFGAVINNSSYFDPKAQPGPVLLDWVGWRGSDELTSFLKVMRAKNWQDFREAFHTYQVPAMNMLYADKKGNIGLMPAYGQPVLKDTSKTLELVKTRDNPIVGILKPTEQENPYNPKEGFIASANNKPFEDPPIPYALSYSSNQRFLRMKQLMEEASLVSPQFLKKLQQDTYSAESHNLNRLWLRRIDKLSLPLELHEAYDSLSAWQGDYDEKSPGAALFELVAYWAWQERLSVLKETSWRKQYLSQQSEPWGLLAPWVQSMEQDKLEKSFESWLKKAHKDWEKFPTWGDLHVQTQMSPLGMLPVIGSRYQRQTHGLSGGNNTLNKAGRRFSNKQEQVTYGASARHVSDLSSLDENYFILNGGQDGWLFNENIDDQTPLWRRGEYLKIPMSQKAMEKWFRKHKTELMPLEGS